MLPQIKQLSKSTNSCPNDARRDTYISVHKTCITRAIRAPIDRQPESPTTWASATAAAAQRVVPFAIAASVLVGPSSEARAATDISTPSIVPLRRDLVEEMLVQRFSARLRALGDQQLATLLERLMKEDAALPTDVLLAQPPLPPPAASPSQPQPQRYLGQERDPQGQVDRPRSRMGGNTSSSVGRGPGDSEDFPQVPQNGGDTTLGGPVAVHEDDEGGQQEEEEEERDDTAALLRLGAAGGGVKDEDAVPDANSALREDDGKDVNPGQRPKDEMILGGGGAVAVQDGLGGGRTGKVIAFGAGFAALAATGAAIVGRKWSSFASGEKQNEASTSGELPPITEPKEAPAPNDEARPAGELSPANGSSPTVQPPFKLGNGISGAGPSLHAAHASEINAGTQPDGVQGGAPFAGAGGGAAFPAGGETNGQGSTGVLWRRKETEPDADVGESFERRRSGPSAAAAAAGARKNGAPMAQSMATTRNLVGRDDSEITPDLWRIPIEQLRGVHTSTARDGIGADGAAALARRTSPSTRKRPSPRTQRPWIGRETFRHSERALDNAESVAGVPRMKSSNEAEGGR